jgi:nicotinamidase-related amidase
MPGPVLIVIDLQRDYFPGGRFELPRIERVVARAAALLAQFRARRLPVVHVRHLELDPAVGFLLEDSDGAAIDPRVAPEGDELRLSKHWPNAFRETPLAAILASLRPDELVLCGAMSNMCVDATTKAAFDAGYRCTVVEDACAASDLEFRGRAIPAGQVHGAFMAALASGYAEVLDSQALAARLATD